MAVKLKYSIAKRNCLMILIWFFLDDRETPYVKVTGNVPAPLRAFSLTRCHGTCQSVAIPVNIIFQSIKIVPVGQQFPLGRTSNWIFRSFPETNAISLVANGGSLRKFHFSIANIAIFLQKK